MMQHRLPGLPDGTTVTAARLLVAPRRSAGGMALIPPPARPARSRQATPLPPPVERPPSAWVASPAGARSVSVAGLWGTLGDHDPAAAARDNDNLLPGERPAPGGEPLWRRLARVLQPPVALLIAADGPIGWPAPLYPFQVTGVQALLTRPAVLLADEMGLGKTIQVAAALRILMLQRRATAALVVAPAGLLSQWRAQLDAWAPELRVSVVRGSPRERAAQWATPAHVVVAGYESVRADFAAFGAVSPYRRYWDVVALDEAQRIKNRDAEVSWLCKLLPRRHAWALTGTPLENRLDDLASIIEFVQPLAPGGAPPVWVEGPALRARHRAVQLRRRKAEVLTQLPAKTVEVVRLRLEGGQRQSYDLAEQQGIVELRRLGTGARVEHVLELITRLKQICNACPRTGESAKLDDMAERLEALRAAGHRALIFSQFTDDRFGVRAIAERLRPFAPLLYTGDMAMRARDLVIDQFKANPGHSALVLSLRAGGQGLNLTEASYVFHFDRWWNPAVERQAEDRSHRLGQDLPVTVYTYLCEETIEERIDAILRAKQALFDQLVDDVSLDLDSRLSAADLFGLFGLTTGDEP